jgi:hypothetical protein
MTYSHWLDAITNTDTFLDHNVQAHTTNDTDRRQEDRVGESFMSRGNRLG